ncbi:MAG: hypothetical protein ACK5LR_01615 [Mangrovibacterium sp.]
MRYEYIMYLDYIFPNAMRIHVYSDYIFPNVIRIHFGFRYISMTYH